MTPEEVVPPAEVAPSPAEIFLAEMNGISGADPHLSRQLGLTPAEPDWPSVTSMKFAPDGEVHLMSGGNIAVRLRVGDGS